MLRGTWYLVPVKLHPSSVASMSRLYHVCYNVWVERQLAGVSMCGTQNRVQADAAGLKRRTTSLPSHSSPGARLKLTRSGGGKYSGPRLDRGLVSPLWPPLCAWADTRTPCLVRASRLWQPSWQGGGGGRGHGAAASAADATATCLMLLKDA